MIKFFSYMSDCGELYDFFSLIMWTVLAILLLVIYSKRADMFSNKTKTTFKLFVLLALSWIIGDIHFILKYAFKTDLSIMNGNIGEIMTCILIFLLIESDFEKWERVFKGKNSIYLWMGIYAFGAIVLHIKGQGIDPGKAPWYWSEYFVCLAFVTLALVVGIRRLVAGDIRSAYCMSFFIYVVIQFLASAFGTFAFVYRNVTGHGIQNVMAIRVMDLAGVIATFFALIPNIFLLSKKT